MGIDSEITFRSDMTVLLIDSMGSDESVLMAARVSTGAGTHEKNPERDAGLINYLMRDRHGSPFEHNAFTFYVEAPIFVFREFMRHRIASYNEESGRYKQLSPTFYIPNKERNIVQVGKPGAYTFTPGSDYQHETITEALASEALSSYTKYQKMLDAGVAREVARSILPVGIYSSMYVTMNSRSLMNFLSLRTLKPESHFPSFPQREIEMVAEQMEVLWAEKMPITYKAFQSNGWVSP